VLLSELLDRAELAPATVLHPPGRAGDVEVSDVTNDTRQVAPGALYVCIPGRTVDGHALAGAAVDAGAVALVVDHALDAGVPQVVVADPRAAMAPLAARLWGDPSRHLAVVGVTGTNGKTTVTQVLGRVLERLGRRTAVLGTLDGPRTTPESSDLQRWLAARRAESVDTVCMEVSSHGLAHGRVDEVRFDVGVFTNLSRDHLDEHGDMEAYFAAKARLFEAGRTAEGLVCRDDPYGARLLAGEGPGVPLDLAPLHGYGLGEVSDVDLSVRGSRFTWRGEAVRTSLIGRFNVQNAVAVAGVAERLGHHAGDIATALADAGPVAGRFQPVAGPAGSPAVVVDYAHTPAALEVAITTARELAPEARVVLVFGCGGDRDAGKRPLMGEVAAREADVTVVTSDNPRSEDPGAIIDAIVGGWSDTPARRGELLVEPDRSAAIGLAVGLAGPGDVVVVAGKGHERTQVVGDDVRPFDDVEVAAAALAATVAPYGGRPPGGTTP
jgi:UDP-N-acetylmuramoyl-L-alanyl-D-glutamate--2,6-diaminopimelate ligase